MRVAAGTLQIEPTEHGGRVLHTAQPGAAITGSASAKLFYPPGLLH